MPSPELPNSLTGQYLLGYHGCDASVGEAILSGKTTHLKMSANAYDWLGHGAYFWIDSPKRALEWAKDRKGTGAKIKKPFVLGAVIQPGFCLNLTDVRATDSVAIAYKLLVEDLNKAGEPIPANDVVKDAVSLVRKLDCAVINFLHQLREDNKEQAYDSVLGVFEEGQPAFSGSYIKQRTHIQIAIRNLDGCLKGYFRVPGY